MDSILDSNSVVLFNTLGAFIFNNVSVRGRQADDPEAWLHECSFFGGNLVCVSRTAGEFPRCHSKSRPYRQRIASREQV